MKNIFIIMFVIAFFGLPAQNPSVAWARGFGKYTPNGPYYIGVQGYGIVTDASGNVISSGGFQDTIDFDPGVGVYTIAAVTNTSGAPDGYISKLDASGNFIWAITLGSSKYDFCNSVTTDASSNIYVTGVFNGTVDFDPGAGTYTLASVTNESAYVLKLSPSGAFIWAKAIIANPSSQGFSVKADASGNVFCSGFFGASADFDPGPGTFSLTSNGGMDAFVLKLDQNGNFVWAKNIGGPSSGDYGYAVNLDASGNVFVAGTFSTSADLDPGASSYTVNSAGNLDVFVVKLNSLGNFVWGTAAGGSGFDVLRSAAVDASGNIFYTGEFALTPDFDPGPGTFTMTSQGGNDSYITKLNSSGNFVWAKRVGSTGAEEGWQLSLDAAGNVYYTGAFQNTVDFDPGPGTYTVAAGNGWDMYVSKLDNSGNFLWAFGAGASSPPGCSDAGYGIYVDAAGNVYGTGEFCGTPDFDPGAGTYTVAAGPNTTGHVNAFVVKYGPTGGVGLTEVTGQLRTRIFPNPNKGEFVIELNSSKLSDLLIYNSLGETVFKQNISQGNNKIKVENLSPGLYYYTLSMNGTNIESGKIIIE